MKVGTIKFYGRMKGFGFILPDDLSDDVFVHHKDLRDRKFLKEGQRVRFEMAEWNGRPCAANVEVIQESPAIPLAIVGGGR